MTLYRPHIPTSTDILVAWYVSVCIYICIHIYIYTHVYLVMQDFYHPQSLTVKPYFSQYRAPMTPVGPLNSRRGAYAFERFYQGCRPVWKCGAWALGQDLHFLSRPHGSGEVPLARLLSFIVVCELPGSVLSWVAPSLNQNLRLHDVGVWIHASSRGTALLQHHPSR